MLSYLSNLNYNLLHDCLLKINVHQIIHDSSNVLLDFCLKNKKTFFKKLS